MFVAFDYYRIFYFVAKCGSISGVAKELYLSQPTITIELKKLEQQTGLQLFTRNNRGVSLTHEGEYLYRKVAPAIEMLLDAGMELDKLSHLDTGSVSINFNNVGTREVFAPVLEGFHKEYPNLNIYTCILERSNIKPAIDSSIVDISISSRPAEKSDMAPPVMSDNDSPDNPLVEYSLGAFKDIFLISADTIPDNLSGFKSAPIIYCALRSSNLRQRYEQVLDQPEELRRQSIYINDPQAIAPIMQAGKYSAIVPGLVFNSIADDSGLKVINAKGLSLETEYVMHFSTKQGGSLAASVLRDYFLNHPLFSVKHIDLSL